MDSSAFEAGRAFERFDNGALDRAEFQRLMVNLAMGGGAPQQAADALQQAHKQHA